MRMGSVFHSVSIEMGSGAARGHAQPRRARAAFEQAPDGRNWGPCFLLTAQAESKQNTSQREGGKEGEEGTEGTTGRNHDHDHDDDEGPGEAPLQALTSADATTRSGPQRLSSSSTAGPQRGPCKRQWGQATMSPPTGT